MKIVTIHGHEYIEFYNGKQFKVKSLDEGRSTGELRVTLELTDEEKMSFPDGVLNTSETLNYRGFQSSVLRIKSNGDGDKVFIFTGLINRCGF